MDDYILSHIRTPVLVFALISITAIFSVGIGAWS